MNCIVSSLLHDAETTRRVTRVLLNHVAPKNKEEAMTILHSRIGVYTNDKTAMKSEVDQYFG